MRRFAFIEVPSPAQDDFLDLIAEAADDRDEHDAISFRLMWVERI
jgi:hypothetical protein